MAAGARGEPCSSVSTPSRFSEMRVKREEKEKMKMSVEKTRKAV